MALIDRDTALERMKSMAGCATCDNYNYVRCRRSKMICVENLKGRRLR